MTKEFLSPVKVIEISQPMGVFYIGKMQSGELLKVANRNLSRYKNVEKGLQRDRSPKQINSIKEYLTREDATFPNTIIISVGYDDQSNSNWEYDDVTGSLLIKNLPDSVNIIDGQHRLFGLEDFPDFEIPVSIFLGLPEAEQGMVFSTINGNQRTVDSSLIYELFGMSDKRYEEVVSYKIVSALNSDKKSPWFQKIKMLGKAKNDGDISQGAFSKYIHINLISKGKVMRSLFEKEKDEIMYKILLDFFTAVSVSFPEAWRNENSEFILTKTTGFNGFMSFFIDLAKLSKLNDFSLDQKFFEERIKKVIPEFGKFTNVEYPSGATGQNEIRRILRQALTDEEKDLIGIKK